MKKKPEQPPPLRKQIREVRLDLGLTHDEVAERCGWSPNFNVMLESESEKSSKEINLKQLVKLAHALGARATYEPGKGWAFRRRRKSK